jgi:hypothetical protein
MVKVKLSLCLTDEALRLEDSWASEGIASPSIKIDLWTRWR